MNRLRSAVCAVLLVFGLAGCNEEPKPRFEPRESSETPTSPTTSTTTDPPEPEGLVEPEMPALARKHTKKGAEAFAVHYWEMAEYALLSGDTKPLEVLGTEGCEKCAAGLRYIKSVYRRGGTVVGGETTETVGGSKPFQSGDSTGFEVDLKVRNTKQTVSFPNRKDNELYRSSTLEVRFFIKSIESGFRAFYWESE